MPCTMWGLPPMKPSAAKMSSIRWWNGVLRRPMRWNIAMPMGSISAGYIGSTTGRPAGAVRSSVSESCGNSGNFILNFGHGCLLWISGQERNLAPAPWGSFVQTGAWSSWISGLRLKKKRRSSRKIMRNVAEVYHVKRYSKQRLCNTTKALVRGNPLKPRPKEAVCEKEIT